MRFQGMLRTAGLALATCATLAFLGGCSEDTTQPDKSGTFFGPSQNVGNGTAKTYVTLDADGNPTEVGLRMSETALDGLPDSLPTPSQMFMLDFPDEASATAFDHLMLDWNHRGHDPEIFFGKPHFDMHFYMIDMASVQAIDPTKPEFWTKAANLPDSKYVPQDYVLPPGSPDSNTVPYMGLHWLDSTAGLIPGVYDFTEIFIYGSYDGEMTFMEPMMTREWMLTKPSLNENIKLPQAYKKSGYYPTTYVVRFDDEKKEYVIALGGMTMRQGS